MSTTANPTRTRATGRNPAATTNGDSAVRPRVRGSGRVTERGTEPREAQYDLLTAALLGAAIGAGTTLLLRRGPSGGRPIGPAWRVAREGARAGAKMAGRGARFAWDQGVDAWDR